MGRERSFRLWLPCLVMLAACLHAPFVRGASKTNKTLLVVQTVGQAPGYSGSFNVYTANLGYSAARGLNYGAASAMEPDPAMTGIAQMPAVVAQDAQGNPLSQGALLAAANAEILGQAASLATGLAQYMNSAGCGSALFSFRQQVMVQGNASPMALVWQEIVDVNGRPRYGNVQLVPSAPNFVYGLYLPQAVDATLPASFTSLSADALGGSQIGASLPPPGALQWLQVNQQLQPQTAAQVFALNGAFDAPTVNPAATATTPGCQSVTVNDQNQLVCDPDYGLKCLINHASDAGCPVVPINGYSDFISLENANGASGGWLDYVRSLTPVYVTSTNAQGQTVRTAQVSVDVNQRLWQQQAALNCQPSFQPPLSYVGYYIYPVVFGLNCVSLSGSQVYLFGTSSMQFAPGYVYGTASNGELLPSGTVQTIQGNGTASCPSITGAILEGAQYSFDYSQLPECTYFIPDGNQYQISTPNNGNVTWGYDVNDATAGGYIVNETPGITTVSAVNAGGGSYSNSGTIGYQVLSVVDRYWVTPDGQYFALGEQTSLPQVPQQPYSKTVTLPAGADETAYGDLIIDPFHTSQIYDYLDDTVNGLPASAYPYVAPIAIQQ